MMRHNIALYRERHRRDARPSEAIISANGKDSRFNATALIVSALFRVRGAKREELFEPYLGVRVFARCSLAA